MVGCSKQLATMMRELYSVHLSFDGRLWEWNGTLRRPEYNRPREQLKEYLSHSGAPQRSIDIYLGFFPERDGRKRFHLLYDAHLPQDARCGPLVEPIAWVSSQRARDYEPELWEGLIAHLKETPSPAHVLLPPEFKKYVNQEHIQLAGSTDDQKKLSPVVIATETERNNPQYWNMFRLD